MTLRDLFNRHEINTAKRNMLMSRATQFKGLWDNFPLLKEVKKA